MTPKDPAQDNDTALSIEDQERYLVFKAGNQTYATSLVSVREVIQYQEPSPIPNMKSYFLGVINLRGEVVGVADLRSFLGLTAEQTTSLLVFATEQGPLACAVDQVLRVDSFKPESIESNPNVKTRFPIEYFKGLVRADEQFIQLIDIKQILAHDNPVAIEKMTA